MFYHVYREGGEQDTPRGEGILTCAHRVQSCTIILHPDLKKDIYEPKIGIQKRM
jgi:hypothetical protein